MPTTQRYCADCEKSLDKNAFRPTTDASGHVHDNQHAICDQCGESKSVSCYELWSDKT
jgi:hypothetical protein